MLPDHIGLLDGLAREIAATGDRTSLLALLLVHAPCIARIDGLLGYRQGDETAEAGARDLARLLRPTDQVHRIDRATLACVLPHLQHAGQAWSAAYRIVQSFSRQVEVGDISLQAQPALGMAFFPTDATDADTLLQRATLAVQAAPRAQDRIAVYDPEHHAADQLALSLQTNLRRAIDEQGLALRFQPQLDLRSGEIVACEALTRWEDPGFGTVSPQVFIGAAETAGWMPRLTHRLLHTSLRQLNALGGGLAMALNLSAQDLAEKDLAELVAQVLATWNIAAPRLVLEITETTAMEPSLDLERNLRRLRELGVRLSIDDFGTGYSSLARLKSLPVDEIKIDVSFVRDMTRRSEDENIVRSVIELAHSLGVRVVAEGVENRDTLNRLATLGCDMAQGFHISPPLAATELKDFMRRHRPGLWRLMP